MIEDNIIDSLLSINLTEYEGTTRQAMPAGTFRFIFVGYEGHKANSGSIGIKLRFKIEDVLAIRGKLSEEDTQSLIGKEIATTFYTTVVDKVSGQPDPKASKDGVRNLKGFLSIIATGEVNSPEIDGNLGDVLQGMINNIYFHGKITNKADKLDPSIVYANLDTGQSSIVSFAKLMSQAA